MIGSECNVLPYSTDPERRRRVRATQLCGLFALAVAGAWAWRPLTRPAIAPLEIRADAMPGEDALPALATFNTTTFAVQLWHEPPTPIEATPKPNEHETPIRLELVGIIKDGSQLLAALYDPETDMLRIVADGDQLGRHTVTSIELASVELSDGSNTRRLMLQKDQS